MITRQDYLDQKATHREYYGPFVDKSVIDYVVRKIGPDRLLASTDPHLNDIPLKEWDGLACRIYRSPCAIKKCGDFETLAGLVCILKEAARQWLDAQKKPDSQVTPTPQSV